MQTDVDDLNKQFCESSREEESSYLFQENASIELFLHLYQLVLKQ